MYRRPVRLGLPAMAPPGARTGSRAGKQPGFQLSVGDVVARSTWLPCPMSTCVHDLVRRLRCVKCGKAGKRPAAELSQLARRQPSQMDDAPRPPSSAAVIASARNAGTSSTVTSTWHDRRALRFAGAIANVTDPEARPDDPASRKRKLIQEPEPFQKVRRDRNRK